MKENALLFALAAGGAALYFLSKPKEPQLPVQNTGSGGFRTANWFPQLQPVVVGRQGGVASGARRLDIGGLIAGGGAAIASILTAARNFDRDPTRATNAQDILITNAVNPGTWVDTPVDYGLGTGGSPAFDTTPDWNDAFDGSAWV